MEDENNLSSMVTYFQTKLLKMHGGSNSTLPTLKLKCVSKCVLLKCIIKVFIIKGCIIVNAN